MPLFWKAHIAIDFTENGIPTTNNGVGIGGHLYTSLTAFYVFNTPYGEDSYYVAPVLLEEGEYQPISKAVVEALVDKPTAAPFAPYKTYHGTVWAVQDNSQFRRT